MYTKKYTSSDISRKMKLYLIDPDLKQEEYIYKPMDEHKLYLTPTIEQACRYNYPKLEDSLNLNPDMGINIGVYEGVFDGRERLIPPNVLCEQKMRWDAHAIKAYQIIDPIKLIRTGYINVSKNKSDEAFIVHPFNDFSIEAVVHSPMHLYIKHISKVVNWYIQ